MYGSISFSFFYSLFIAAIAKRKKKRKIFSNGWLRRPLIRNCYGTSYHIRSSSPLLSIRLSSLPLKKREEKKRKKKERKRKMI